MIGDWYRRIRDGLLEKWVDLILRRSKEVIGFCGVLGLICGVYALIELDIVTDQDEIVSKNQDYYKNYRRFLKEFGDVEYIYVVIEGGKRRGVEFVDRLEERLEFEGGVEKVISKVDMDWRELMFGNEDDMWVDDLKSLLMVLEGFEGKKVGGLEDIVRNLRVEGETLGIVGWFFRDMRDFLKGGSISSLKRVEKDLELKLGWRRYLFSENQKIVLMMILPEKDYGTLEVVSEPLRRIRVGVKEVLKDFPDLRVGVTGRPVLQADEMRVTNEDMILSSMIAIGGVSGLFMIFLGNILRPLLGVGVLGVAIMMTFGLTTFVIGSLNILSIVFTLIMVGLGVDFGIHILMRYQEELRRFGSVEVGVRRAILKCGKGNLTAGLTSSLVFYLGMLLDLQGLVELAFISGSGILITMVMMLSLLPAVLLEVDRGRRLERVLGFKDLINIGKLYGFLERNGKKGIVFWGILVMGSIFVFIWGGGFHFNSNLLELQAEGVESVDYEYKLIENGFSSWFLASRVKDLKELEEKYGRFKELGSVSKVESIVDHMRLDMGLMERVLRSLVWLRRMGGVSMGYGGLEVELDGVMGKLELLGEGEGEVREVMGLIEGVKSILEGEGGMGRMREFEVNFFRSVEGFLGLVGGMVGRLEGFEGVGMLEDLEGVLPQVVWDRFVGSDLPEELYIEGKEWGGKLLGCYRYDDGKGFYELEVGLDEGGKERCERLLRGTGYQKPYILYVYPEGDIWSEAGMERFIVEARGVDEGVTGGVVMFYETNILIKEGLKWLSLGAVLVIIGILVLNFGGLKPVILSAMPLGIGLVSLMGLMGLSEVLEWEDRVSFNLANFFAVPMLIGIGIDYGAHLVHDRGKSFVIIRAIILSGLTTVLSLGSLVLASHRGLSSLGLMMGFGSLMIFCSAVMILPFLLGNKKDKEGGELKF